MSWSERQQAMLRAMGLRVWSPPVGTGADEEAASAVHEVPLPDERSRTGAQSAPAQAAARPAAASLPPALHHPAPMPSGRPLAPAGDVAAMDWGQLRAAVGECRACGLCESRNNTVFGVGHERAHWLVVGEAPGEQEDQQGQPFVGQAGRLLDNMLRALGLTREEGPPEQQVFITNTLKCRPPRNRNPAPEELASCEPFLNRQIELLRPRIILAMGRFAVQSLLRSSEPIGKLRGRVHQYQGVPLIVTYHPAYLLRNPVDKARAWDDLCLAMATLRAQRPELPSP